MRTANPDLKNERTHQIAKAATACFVEKGFHQTSIQDIAQAATMSVGLVYRYYASKEEIVAAVARIDRDEMIAAIEALADSGAVRAAWHTLTRALVKSSIAPETLRLTLEIAAESGRNDALLANLRDDDAALKLSLKNKLTKQRVPNAGEAAERYLLMLDGMVWRASLNGAPSASTLKSHIAMMVDTLVQTADH